MKVILLILSLSVSISIFAQGKKDYLWKVTKQGSSLELYLFGTMHLPSKIDNHPAAKKIIDTKRPQYYIGENTENPSENQLYNNVRSVLGSYNSAFLNCAGFNMYYSPPNYDVLKPEHPNFRYTYQCLMGTGQNLEALVGRDLYHAFVEIKYREEIPYPRIDNQARQNVHSFLQIYNPRVAYDTVLRKGIALKDQSLSSPAIDSVLESYLINNGATPLTGFDTNYDLASLQRIMNDLHRSYSNAGKGIILQDDQNRRPNNNSEIFHYQTNSYSQATNVILTALYNNNNPNNNQGNSSYSLYFQKSDDAFITGCSQRETSCSNEYIDLMFNRNILWANKIDQMFSNTNFNNKVIFGMGGLNHFFGKHGMLYRLIIEGNGYSVKRVRINSKGVIYTDDVTNSDMYVE